MHIARPIFSVDLRHERAGAAVRGKSIRMNGGVKMKYQLVSPRGASARKRSVIKWAEKEILTISW